jgi:ABC-type phosphate transport system substrate-binding protein
MPDHPTTKTAAKSLALALGLGIALVLGGRLLFRGPEPTGPILVKAPSAQPPMEARPEEQVAGASYRPRPGVSGVLRSAGSDTMNNLMAHIYFNKSPGRALDPLRLEFLRFVLSREGQEIVARDGYTPLPAEVLAEERAKLGGEARDRG